MAQVKPSERHFIHLLTTRPRAVIEETLGPQFKQSGVLPGVSDVRPKRPREEGGGEADPPPLVPRPFKRTRVQ